MIVKKHRYFLVNGQKKRETATWVLCGTISSSPIDDYRGVSIGQSVIHPNTGILVDHWYLSSVSSPAYDGELNSFEYVSELVIDMDPLSPSYGKEVVVSRPTKVLSSNYDIYSMPLKDGYVEISQVDFNT